MYAPSKPSTFRRTSERKVTDPNEAVAIRADRRLQKEMEAFESNVFSVAAHSVPAKPLERDDKSDRLVTQMATEDTSRLDAEGVVY